MSVRDAQLEDCAAIGDIWASAIPYLVRSTDRVVFDLEADGRLGRRHWVAEIDGRVAGTAVARPVADDEVFVGVEVHPDYGSRGAGLALLRTAVQAFPGVTNMAAVCRDDPISLGFAVRNGFLPEGEHRVCRVDPRTVADAGPPPDGLRAVTLDHLDDLQQLLDTYNAAAGDDPSGLSRPYTLEQLHAHWWDSPDNAPELAWALLADDPDAPGRAVVASFTSVQVDRARARAWSSMTATRPAYRGRGLATWVKRRTLRSLAEAGVSEAWTANDATNAPMVAVNDALGYRPAGKSISVRRRLHH